MRLVLAFEIEGNLFAFFVGRRFFQDLAHHKFLIENKVIESNKVFVYDFYYKEPKLLIVILVAEKHHIRDGNDKNSFSVFFESNLQKNIKSTYCFSRKIMFYI